MTIIIILPGPLSNHTPYRWFGADDVVFDIRLRLTIECPEIETLQCRHSSSTALSGYTRRTEVPNSCFIGAISVNRESTSPMAHLSTRVGPYFRPVQLTGRALTIQLSGVFTPQRAQEDILLEMTSLLLIHAYYDSPLHSQLETGYL